jgi:hypothetical protein
MRKEFIMNTKRTIFLMIAALGLSALAALAQTPPPDRVTVPLSNPAKPAAIEARILFGSIKVVGYEGKEVEVTATPREKALGDKTGPVIFGGDVLRTLRDATRAYTYTLPGTGRAARDKEQEDKEKKAKTEGMKQIPLESSGLTIEENDNKVEISLQSWRRGYDLEIRVPSGSSVDLGGSNCEEIRVENVSGAIEISSANGNIKLLNVAGPVTANTTSGDIEAVLTRIPADKPMSFATFTGDVDLSLPADAKASLRIKSNTGQLYTDFDIALKTLPAEPERTTSKEGARFRVSLERSVFGTINGGGPELKLQNYNGDIYIRRKK